MAETAPPGWYHAETDPPATERYWDGSQWIGEPRHAAPPPPDGAGGFPIGSLYDSEAASRSPWDTRWWLFSFRGRAHRAHWWAGQAVLLLELSLGFGIAGAIGTAPAGLSAAAAMVLLATFVIWLWMLLAVNVKRWHDVDKGGYWMLIVLVPIIGGLWAFVETALEPGTPGPNRYGPSPKR